MPNGFMWFDVSTTADNVEAVTNFYSAILDGPLVPDETDGPYMTWMINDGTPWAAITRSENTDLAGRWIPYVHVDDHDAALAAALAAGGTVLQERTTGPAGDATIVSDPAGAAIALWVPADATE